MFVTSVEAAVKTTSVPSQAALPTASEVRATVTVVVGNTMKSVMILETTTS